MSKVSQFFLAIKIHCIREPDIQKMLVQNLEVNKLLERNQHFLISPGELFNQNGITFPVLLSLLCLLLMK